MTDHNFGNEQFYYLNQVHTVTVTVMGMQRKNRLDTPSKQETQITTFTIKQTWPSV